MVAGGQPRTDCFCRSQNQRRRLQAAEQTLYWGETVINLCCDNGYAMWGVPIMDNNALKGALIVQGIDLETGAPDLPGRVQHAAGALLKLALRENLLPRAAVELARQRAARESDRFYAIEAAKKDSVSDDLRSIYLDEEPDLLAAIKESDTQRARSILNRILTAIYALAGDRMDLLKSSVLELIVMMNRAAVEAGAEPSTALGSNYRSLTELSEIEDEEDLSTWVRRMLETLIDCIRGNHEFPHSVLLLRAIRHMQANLHQHLRRDDVARVAGVSPSHFSKLVTERMGRSFSHLLSQMRVNKAKELLARTDKSLAEIGAECGFYDQSHFNKTFRAALTLSPGDYRKRVRTGKKHVCT